MGASSADTCVTCRDAAEGAAVCDTEWEVSTQTELYNKISSFVHYGTTGNSIMALGDTVTALSNTYSGSEISESSNVMFYLRGLYGLLQCEEALQCELNGGGTRRVMNVYFDTGGGVWKMKGLRFVDGTTSEFYSGAGLYLGSSAKVVMTMCEFKNNQAGGNHVSAFRPAAFRHFTKPPLHPQLTPPPLEPPLSSLSSLSREEVSTFTAHPTPSTSTRRPSAATRRQTATTSTSTTAP